MADHKAEFLFKYQRQDPSEIFELLERLGEGSYGSVYKALDRRDSKTVAVKIIPVEKDISELQKEIDILGHCQYIHIVEYKGSYLKDNNVWIVMEYCGVGSVADLISICGLTLSEEQISVICLHVLLGLQYLHRKRHIHRDVKCGNVLLDSLGNAKLADFGVSAELTNTISKRQTVIGTPYWMAPEVLRETSYDSKADVWSLGITAIEMATGRPPHSNVHPMRAIFMIPNRPPPTLPDSENWSIDFQEFIAACLVKDPEDRPDVDTLLESAFIRGAKSKALIQDLVHESMPTVDEYRSSHTIAAGVETASTMGTAASFYDTSCGDASGTIVSRENLGTSVNQDTMLVSDTCDFSGTMIQADSHASGTIRPAYMKQFDAQFSTDTVGFNGGVAESQDDFVNFGLHNASESETEFSDMWLEKNASLVDLQHALEVLEAAHERESRALEEFYGKRRATLQSLIRAREKQ